MRRPQQILTAMIVVCISAAMSLAAGLIDTVNADSTRITADGDVRTTMSGDFVGGHDMRRIARVATGKGSAISCDLHVTPREPITIEIEEIDGRQRDLRAYLI